MTDNLQPKQKNKRAARFGRLAVAFVVTMLVAPRVLTVVAGPSSRWSGSFGIFLFLIPGVAASLWALFSIIAAVIFVRREGFLVSLASCIGIGFLLAIVGTIVTLAIYNIPPYGNGP
jgi:hypothetical protein